MQPNYTSHNAITLDINGTITAPQGFLAAGVACGLKKNGQPDLALVVSDRPAVAAGVFTRNQVRGHSLLRTMARIESGMARGLVINSGNANACVGPVGDEDAEAMSAFAAAKLGCTADEVLCGSTGVIGKRLDLAAIQRGIAAAVDALASTKEAGNAAERAIMTTDLKPKEGSVCVQIGDRRVTFGGIAKGSGMIHPDMATMIAVITTDCAIDPVMLRRMLSRAADRSFNRVSVDGDTSVCDMIVALANGAAGNLPLQSGSADEAMAGQALTVLCRHLARMVAEDGEGATKLIEIAVSGARTATDARLIAASVARSPLVKTALYGEDANWGRILTAAGYSGAQFNPAGCQIRLNGLTVCERGSALPFDELEAKKRLSEARILVEMNLSDGDAADFYWTCDFSPEYIRINGSYRS